MSIIKRNKINELISLTNNDSLSNIHSKNLRPANQIFNIYTAKNEKNINFSFKAPSSNQSRGSKRVLIYNRNNKKKIKSGNNYTNEYLKEESQKKYNGNILHLKNEDRNKKKINVLNIKGKDDLGNTHEKSEHQNIEYYFNFIEIIASLIFPCCLSGNLKLKNDYYNNGIDFLYQKLDIILYLRNVILFDIINQTIIDGNKKQIINLLSRPILSIDNTEKNEVDIFYKDYKENEFDKFFDGMIDLLNKSDKENREKNLINLSNKKLKELI